MSIYDSKIVQFFRDLANFRTFKKDMKREDSLADSTFTKLNLKRNWFGNIVYTQIDCTDEDLMNADYNESHMVEIKLKPYVNYLSTKMGWGDYLTLRVSNFVDENNEKSLSYGVMFVFTGYCMTLTKLLVFNLLNAILLGGGIWALFHFLI